MVSARDGSCRHNAKRGQVSVLNIGEAQAGTEWWSMAVAIFAVVVAVVAAYFQRVHNRLSVRPLADIQFRDMNNQIRIMLANNGTGPLIVSKLRVFKAKGGSWDSLFAAVPTSPSDWTFYVGNIDEKSIRPGSSVNLLEFSYDPSDSSDSIFADELRSELSQMTVVVVYRDIYNKQVAEYSKKLEWFGRNL